MITSIPPIPPLARKAIASFCLVLAASPSQAAPAPIDLAALRTPSVCPSFATLNAATHTCTIDTAEAAKISDPKLCDRSPLLTFKVAADGKATCTLADPTGAQNTFTAECAPLAGHTATRTGEGQDAICAYSRPEANISARSDYVGDCFIVKSAIPGLPVTGSRHWIVTHQDDTNAQDPNLTLIPASDWGPGFVWDVLQRMLPIAGCTPKTTEVQPVSMPASTLGQHGAIRRGFVYGLLTAPYKYFPSDKSFQAGLPVGPYLGWRIGESGVGGTVVAAFTLGAVKANTTKDDPTDSSKPPIVTGQTDLMALSAAVGVIFDITRNPNKSGFKAGILVGKDHVNQSANINYPQNRQTWVAIQLGFDFTDY